MIARLPYERRKNGFTNTNLIVEHVACEEAQYSEATTREIVVAQRIIVSGSIRPVRAAVDFDDELGMQAGEVDVVRTELHLLTKMVAIGPQRVE